MKYHNTEELIEILASKYTPAELCDMLGLTSRALLYCLGDVVFEERDNLEELLRDGE